jgi:hypothetical protein
MGKIWKTRIDPDAQLVDTKVFVTGPTARTMKARFALDIGTPVTILDERLARAVELGPDRSEGPSRLWGPTGPDEGYKVRARLWVMDVELDDHQVRCHHLWPGAGIDGLIGLDILRRGFLGMNLPWGLVEFRWS